MDDQNFERMQEDSPPRGDPDVQEQINSILHTEVIHVISDHASATSLSSDCQQALAAAYSHDLIEPTLRALVRAGNDALVSSVIPQFWNSVPSLDSSLISDVVAALASVKAVAEALHRKITVAVEFLKSQSTEHSKARVILFWAAPRVFSVDTVDLLLQSKGIVTDESDDTVEEMDFQSTFPL